MNITITTPYPVSTNRYYRKFKNIMMISKEGAIFKKTVQWENCRIKPVIYPVRLTVLIHPKLTKKGLPYKSLIDLDNSLKCILDSLINVVYFDDKQVKSIFLEYGDAKINGGATINAIKYTENIRDKVKC